MRHLAVVTAVIAALVAAAPAQAAEITLGVERGLVPYDGVARFHGNLASVEPQNVVLVRDGVAVGSTVASGAFSFALRARAAGTYVAQTATAASAPVAVRLRPRLRARIVGKRQLGRRLLIVGRLLPGRAGPVVLRSYRRRVRVRLAADGRFRVRVPAAWGPNVTGRVALRPRPGYVRVWRRVRLRLAMPNLQIGSHGPAVLMLKRRLWEERYLLPSVDAGFGYRTYEAVLAFQKVHGLPRTGAVDPGFWRLLWRSSAPLPRVRRGDYLEVDKGRQVVLEVRDGHVVGVIHASTGATGNTPPGTWHVYSEVAGWSWVLWQPMYFLRGFAIHGYPSVPPWPASHGCVRVPMWLATGLRERWGSGSVVRVYN
jgi:N-acetylmuramoyl-L-alanine amidase